MEADDQDNEAVAANEEKRCRFENVQTVKTQAERIIAESEADDGWLRLIGEEQ